jgi:hypothetical protein
LRGAAFRADEGYGLQAVRNLLKNQSALAAEEWFSILLKWPVVARNPRFAKLTWVFSADGHVAGGELERIQFLLGHVPI